MPERAKVIAAVQEAYDELSRPIGLRDVGEYGVTNLSRLEAEIADRLDGADERDPDTELTVDELRKLAATCRFALDVDNIAKESDMARPLAAGTSAWLLEIREKLIRLAGGEE